MSKLIGRHLSAGEQQSFADRFEEIGGNTIVYSYPDGNYDLVCASDCFWKGPGWEKPFDLDHKPETRPKAREKGKKSEGEDALRSMRRARANVRRLALSNTFDFFVTLTLDKEKVDRYDPKKIMHIVNQWLSNMVQRHGLRYILVPEQHLDGAWHFHGFFGGEVQIVDSGVRWDGRIVYNLPQWSLGFTTAQRLYGEYTAAVAYVCKYIGKQQGQRPMGRWYYSGGGLQQPRKEYCTLNYREVMQEYQGEAVELETPVSRIAVVHHRERG